MKKKELTKKQRHEVYKLAQMLIKEKKCQYICQALFVSLKELHHKLMMGTGRDVYGFALSFCPEIMALKPKNRNIDSAWWDFASHTSLNINVRVWMLDTAIEQTKEIKPERVLNPIKTFNDVKIETYEVAIEYLKKDEVPYSMCVALDNALIDIFHTRRFKVEYIYAKYFKKEFEKNKPKCIPVDSFWFGDYDMQSRIDYFNNIINELKNGTNKKEN